MTRWTAPSPERAAPKPGEPALHRAARLGDAAEISRLVGIGANVDEIFNIGLDPRSREMPATPLMVAAGSGDGADVQTVKLLLRLGADPTLLAGPNSAAALAATGLGWNYRPGGGDAARLLLLLEAGSPLPQDADAASWLLCRTASDGDADRVRLLLSHGLKAGGHWDPIEASKRGRALIGGILDLEKSEFADILALLPEEVRASRAGDVRQFREQIAAEHSSGPPEYNIPLFCAARSGNAACVEVLLAAGADLHARDNLRRTAMYYAGSAAVVTVLRAAGLPIEDSDRKGGSPLVSIVQDNRPAVVRAFIEAGADVNATYDGGHTVFMAAVGTGRNPEVLRMLIAAGANPHAVSESGRNAFHAALDACGDSNSEQSVRETFGYLRELGVNIEHRDDCGLTPLARALYEGTETEVQVLCDLGANVEAVCPRLCYGGEGSATVDVPLLFHAAQSYGFRSGQMTEALLRAGADPLRTDAEGFTPLHRVVSSLCAESSEYESMYRAFFSGLAGLAIGRGPPPVVREEFVAAVTPPVREYVTQFALKIPVPKHGEHDEQRRGDMLACIVALAAYEAWARRQAGLNAAAGFEPGQGPSGV